MNYRFPRCGHPRAGNTLPGPYAKCRKCKNERDARYRQAHLDYYQRYLSEWRKRNPDYFKQWRLRERIGVEKSNCLLENHWTSFFRPPRSQLTEG